MRSLSLTATPVEGPGIGRSEALQFRIVSPKRPPPAAYKLAALHALLWWRPRCDWEVSADGGAWRRVAAPTLLAAGNGSNWGSGLCICPGADSGDGALSITTARGLGLWHFLFKGGSVFRPGVLAF